MGARPAVLAFLDQVRERFIDQRLKLPALVRRQAPT